MRTAKTLWAACAVGLLLCLLSPLPATAGKPNGKGGKGGGGGGGGDGGGGDSALAAPPVRYVVTPIYPAVGMEENSRFSKMNDIGEAVLGWSGGGELLPENRKGALWRVGDAQAVDLNLLIDPALGYSIYAGSDINNHGDIATAYFDPDGVLRACVLSLADPSEESLHEYEVIDLGMAPGADVTVTYEINDNRDTLGVAQDAATQTLWYWLRLYDSASGSYGPYIDISAQFGTDTIPKLNGIGQAVVANPDVGLLIYDPFTNQTASCAVTGLRGADSFVVNSTGDVLVRSVTEVETKKRQRTYEVHLDIFDSWDGVSAAPIARNFVEPGQSVILNPRALNNQMHAGGGVGSPSTGAIDLPGFEVSTVSELLATEAQGNTAEDLALWNSFPEFEENFVQAMGNSLTGSDGYGNMVVFRSDNSPGSGYPRLSFFLMPILPTP